MPICVIFDSLEFLSCSVTSQMDKLQRRIILKSQLSVWIGSNYEFSYCWNKEYLLFENSHIVKSFIFCCGNKWVQMVACLYVLAPAPCNSDKGKPKRMDGWKIT